LSGSDEILKNMIRVPGAAPARVRRGAPVRYRVLTLVLTQCTMAVILAVQTVLGLSAFWILLPFDGVTGSVSTAQALIRTGHQANGALLLASAVVLSLRAVGNFEKNSRISTQAVEASESRSGLEAAF